jgi:hypothetical protein
VTKPRIANEEEHTGWTEVLFSLEKQINQCFFNCQFYKRETFEKPKAYYMGSLVALTRARDSLLGPIRAYQESREVSLETMDAIDLAQRLRAALQASAPATTEGE